MQSNLIKYNSQYEIEKTLYSLKIYKNITNFTKMLDSKRKINYHSENIHNETVYTMKLYRRKKVRIIINGTDYWRRNYI